jgi:hypothetical protein
MQKAFAQGSAEARTTTATVILSEAKDLQFVGSITKPGAPS